MPCDGLDTSRVLDDGRLALMPHQMRDDWKFVMRGGLVFSWCCVFLVVNVVFYDETHGAVEL